MIRPNCIYNKGNRCTNKNVRKSLWGLGPRMCVYFNFPHKLKCEYEVHYPRPRPFNKERE